MPLLPDLGDAEYLADYLEDVGLTGTGTMGVSSLTYGDILAWQQARGFELWPWEALAIRTASKAYVAQLQEAKDPQCPPPYGHLPTEVDRQVVHRKLTGLFAALSGTTKKAKR